MKISDYLFRDAVLVDFRSSGKSSALKKMGKIISGSHFVIDQKKMLKDIFTREEIESTGIGDGIGLPHARTNGVSEPIIGVAVSKKGIDFDSLDSRPVHIIFLIVVPQNHSKQLLKFLAKITQLLKKPDIKEGILKAKTADEIILLLKKE